MTETPSYPALIELISRLEGKDKKTAEMALYCLNRHDKKEIGLFNEARYLRMKNAELSDAIFAILQDAVGGNPMTMTVEISQKVLFDAKCALINRKIDK